jgi:hypothetical protein
MDIWISSMSNPHFFFFLHLAVKGRNIGWGRGRRRTKTKRSLYSSGVTGRTRPVPLNSGELLCFVRAWLLESASRAVVFASRHDLFPLEKGVMVDHRFSPQVISLLAIRRIVEGLRRGGDGGVLFCRIHCSRNGGAGEAMWMAKLIALGLHSLLCSYSSWLLMNMLAQAFSLVSL